MTRSILAAVAASIAVAVLAGTGCNTTGVGDPCVPEQEYLPSFAGFNVNEVSVESKSFQCLTRLCLVNHFRGRVSCPYGQAPDGNFVPGAHNCCPPNSSTCMPSTSGAGCCTPGIAQPVNAPLDAKGMPADLDNLEAQCVGRTADKAVYCSCRCSNLNGQTNDGANYCQCPDGFRCQQLVTSIGAAGNEGLTGGYCVKAGTEYDPNAPCAKCNASIKNCGLAPQQGVN
jgi:hypothetical protein